MRLAFTSPLDRRTSLSVSDYSTPAITLENEPDSASSDVDSEASE